MRSCWRAEVEHVHVELPASREEDRHLLAHERVGQVGKGERALDRVVVGQGDEVHAPPTRLFVERHGFGVAFPPDVLEHGQVRGARVPRVDVQVAAHQIVRTFISHPLPLRAVLEVRLH